MTTARHESTDQGHDCQIALRAVASPSQKCPRFANRQGQCPSVRGQAATGKIPTTQTLLIAPASRPFCCHHANTSRQSRPVQTGPPRQRPTSRWKPIALYHQISGTSNNPITSSQAAPHGESNAPLAPSENHLVSASRYAIAQAKLSRC